MPRHLYIHVPFCARRCSYCDFSIAVRATAPVDQYIGALRAELSLTRAVDGARLETVYLGGGTPSRLGGAGVAAVLSAVQDRARLAPRTEITIEANPDDVTDATVADWVAAGVNRVSLGAQSFDDSVLQWMHRTHDAGQIARAVTALRAGGIDNLSLDLIFALPAHLNRSWDTDISRALELYPAHVSLYGLTVESHTPISRWKERGAVVEGTEDKYEEEFLFAHEQLSAAGFDHYEVSNFGKPHFHSRHNSAYWTGAPYAGIGPSAHSFDGDVRRWNVSAYSAWIRCLSAAESPIAGEEKLTPEQRDAEAIYLGLRTTKGLGIAGADLDVAQRWVAAGWAQLDSSRASGETAGLSVQDPPPSFGGTAGVSVQDPPPSFGGTAGLALHDPHSFGGQARPGHLTLTPLGWLRLDSIAAELAARRSRTSASVLGANPSHCYI